MNTKNIRHYIATLIMALLPIIAAATPATLSIEDFTIAAGETKTMLIDLNNPDTEVTLVQFDLRLPTGLSIAVEEEELAVDIAGRTTWKKHSLSTSSVNGATRFLLASQSNALISGTSGAVVSVTLTAASTFNGGDIILENQLIVTPTEEATQPADYTYTIAGSGTGEKCATPTITNNNGTLSFACETAGAELTGTVPVSTFTNKYLVTWGLSPCDVGNGGTNFDAKIRRNSTDLEDLFIAHISGMDAMARALLNAADILENSELPAMKKERYASFDAGLSGSPLFLSCQRFFNTIFWA